MNRRLWTPFLFIAIIISKISWSQCNTEISYWNVDKTSCDKVHSPNEKRGKSHWILYDFKVNRTIDSSFGWNANAEEARGFGAKEVIVDYISEGDEWRSLGNFEFPKAVRSNQFQGFAGPSFKGLEVRKVLITVISTYGSQECVVFPDIQFGINAETIQRSDSKDHVLSDDGSILKVFPNPTIDRLKVQILEPFEQNVIVKLSDRYGRVRFQENHIFLSGNQVVDLSMHNCEPGVYLILLESGDKTYTQKVLKI